MIIHDENFDARSGSGDAEMVHAPILLSSSQADVRINWIKLVKVGGETRVEAGKKVT
jgi:hypothetical protein